MNPTSGEHPQVPMVDPGPLDGRFSPSYLAQKRSANRHQMPSQITVQVLYSYRVMHEPDERFWVTTRDISRTGISFFAFEPMYRGEKIRLDLRMERGAIRCVDALIVRCRCLQNGTFEIGAQFGENQDEPPAAAQSAPEVPDIPWILR